MQTGLQYNIYARGTGTLLRDDTDVRHANSMRPYKSNAFPAENNLSQATSVLLTLFSAILVAKHQGHGFCLA